MRQQILTDSHPLGPFRTNGPLSNMPQFGRAFNCKAGYAMVRPPRSAVRFLVMVLGCQNHLRERVVLGSVRTLCVSGWLCLVLSEPSA